MSPPARALTATPPRGLFTWWANTRNRWLANPRFQRWAAAFPLTRWIARKRATALFDLCAGFVYSQVLAAAVQLRLLHHLKEGPVSLVDLASHMALPVEAARRLLDATTALQLTEKRAGATYALGLHGACMLGNPAIESMVAHHALLYRDLRDPVALLRGEVQTELSAYWNYGRANRSDAADYSRLMSTSQAMLVEDLIEAIPWHRCRRLVDIGGGAGTFACAVAEAVPHLTATVFDLPEVAELAQSNVERSDLASRIRVVGGDVFTDPLPEGADTATLVRILHDHDDDQAMAILKAARQSLTAGSLFIAEPMAQTPGAEPVGDAYFGFYLLAMGRGRPRTAAQLADMARTAGFSNVRSLPCRRPFLTQVLAADV